MDYDLINHICKSKNITLADLAKRIGVSRSGLYRSIRDKTMSVQNLEKLAAALEVPVFVFFEDDRNSNSIIKALEAKVEQLVPLLNDSINALFSATHKLNSLLVGYLYYTTSLNDNELKHFDEQTDSKRLRDAIDQLVTDGSMIEIDRTLDNLMTSYLLASGFKLPEINDNEEK